MNKRHFYKRAEDETWKDQIGAVPGYQNQLPMLALLTATGALGGYALSNKKKKKQGTIAGAASLPLTYLAYLAARRNGYLPNTSDSNDILDKGSNWINNKGNAGIDKIKGLFSK